MDSSKCSFFPVELIPELELEQRKHIRWKQIGSLLQTRESTSQRHVHDMQWLKNDKCILLKKKKKKEANCWTFMEDTMIIKSSEGLLRSIYTGDFCCDFSGDFEAM